MQGCATGAPVPGTGNRLGHLKWLGLPIEGLPRQRNFVGAQRFAVRFGRAHAIR